MDIKNRIRSINLLVYDFDGVMTDNNAYIDSSGNESVKVSRADGLAVAEIKKLGFHQLILSTETNPVVLYRAKKLNIDCLYGQKDKKASLLDYIFKLNNSKAINNKINATQNALFIGNDINDLEVMKSVALRLCPSDAHVSIKEISDYILASKGGSGVVRELFDIIK